MIREVVHDWGWIVFTTNPVRFAWWEWVCMIAIAAALAFVPFYLGIRKEMR